MLVPGHLVYLHKAAHLPFVSGKEPGRAVILGYHWVFCCNACFGRVVASDGVMEKSGFVELIGRTMVACLYGEVVVAVVGVENQACLYSRKLKIRLSAPFG